MKKEDRAIQSILHGGEPSKKIFVSMNDNNEIRDAEKKKRDESSAQAEKRLEIFKEFRTPYVCPACGKGMRTKLDSKFWVLRKKCFNCVTAEETQMRINGTYKQYEQKIILNNKLSWLDDQIASVVEWKKTPLPKFYNQVAADGVTVDEEKWTGNTELLLKTADDAIAGFKQQQNEIKDKLSKLL